MNRILASGAVLWSALALLSAMHVGPLGLLDVLFLLAPWVIVPLGLSFMNDSAPLSLARRIQPLAAAFATISFFLPKGTAAGALAVPWLGINGLVALAGLLGLKEAFRGGVPSLLMLAAQLSPPIGGVHFVSSRLGHPLAGFPEPIVLLTAIHFHYTPFAAPILAAMLCRTLSGSWGRIARTAGLGIVGGTPLLAAGFIFSPILKAAAVAVLTLSVILLAVTQVASLGKLRAGRGRLLLALSSIAVVAGMALAAVYEHGFYTGRSWLSISQMAWSHGLLNGVGFSLCGLLGWTLNRENRTVLT